MLAESLAPISWPSKSLRKPKQVHIWPCCSPSTLASLGIGLLLIHLLRVLLTKPCYVAEVEYDSVHAHNLAGLAELFQRVCRRMFSVPPAAVYATPVMVVLLPPRDMSADELALFTRASFRHDPGLEDLTRMWPPLWFR